MATAQVREFASVSAGSICGWTDVWLRHRVYHLTRQRTYFEFSCMPQRENPENDMIDLIAVGQEVI